MKKLLLIIPACLLLVYLPSCTNQDIEYDDFKYQAVYFSYQTPIRTITLGEDFVDTSMDNEYKCQIMATLGGVYSNKKDVTIDFVVDNSLINGFRFNPTDGVELRAMPASYYQLASNKMVIPKGKTAGGVVVQLSDAFFADPLALRNNYVIPLRMTGVTNADTILSGKSSGLSPNPNRLNPTHWEILPKDYVLYAIKYVNKYHGYYLRRGLDKITGKDGIVVSRDVVRRSRYVENDQVVMLSSGSLTIIDMPIVLQDGAGVNLPTPIRLTFDASGNCVVSSPSSAYTVTGNGKFVKAGEKNSWGNKDRDAIYLNYTINRDIMNVVTTDTLVLRNRGVGMEVFSVVPN